METISRDSARCGWCWF